MSVYVPLDADMPVGNNNNIKKITKESRHVNHWSVKLIIFDARYADLEFIANFTLFMEHFMLR